VRKDLWLWIGEVQTSAHDHGMTYEAQASIREWHGHTGILTGMSLMTKRFVDYCFVTLSLLVV
jgi:hypothetical protein